MYLKKQQKNIELKKKYGVINTCIAAGRTSIKYEFVFKNNSHIK